MNYDHRATRLCLFNERCNNAYDCEGTPMKYHHCQKCFVAQPTDFHQTGKPHSIERQQVDLVSRLQEIARKTPDKTFAVSKLVFSKQLVRDARRALREFEKDGRECIEKLDSNPPQVITLPTLDLTLPPLGELTIVSSKSIITIRPCNTTELIAPVIEKEEEDPEEEEVEQPWFDFPEEPFPMDWGSEPVPPCTSEVLGPQATDWMNSDMKLNGAGRGRKSKRGNGRGRGRRKNNMSRSNQRIPRIMVNRGRDFAPSRMRTHLDFDLPFAAPLATALFPYALEYVVLTNPNIVTTVSTALPGYVFYSTAYRKYRTYRFMFSFLVANNDAFPIEIFACPVNFVPSLTANPTAYFSQPEARTRVLSAKGGMDRASLVWTGSVAGFGGSSSTSVEDSYCGTTDNTSPPADNLYLIYGSRTYGNASISAPLFKIRVRIFFGVLRITKPSKLRWFPSSRVKLSYVKVSPTDSKCDEK